jgi:hypothetical protein
LLKQELREFCIERGIEFRIQAASWCLGGCIAIDATRARPEKVLRPDIEDEEMPLMTRPWMLLRGQAQDLLQR